MTHFRILIAGFMLALCIACTPLGVLNSLSPRQQDEKTTDISYGTSAKQRLDIYRPQNAGTKAPVVVFFHGGRWTAGSKKDYAFAANALTAQGFVAVVPDTRLYPAVRFPAFLQDGAAAVMWTKRNIARYGGNPEKIFTMGHSSGAYSAVMLAMDARYMKEVGGGLNDIAGAIGLSGPYDFLPFTDRDVKDIFSTAQDPRQTQPITFASGKRPPVLLLHGEDDTTVYPRNSANLAKALRRHGNTAVTKFYPRVDHIEIVTALSPLFRGQAPVAEDVASFIRNHD